MPRLACAETAAFAARVIGRFILPLALAAALPAAAQQFDFSADQVESNAAGSVATGHARYAQSDLVLSADQLTLSADRSTVTAIGHVVAARAGQRLLADQLVYHIATRAFTATRIRFGAYPYYVEGESAAGSPAEIKVSRATLTYGEPGPWQPTLRAESIVYAPGQRIRTEDSRVGLGSTHFLPFPKITRDLREPLFSHLSATGGFNRTLGAYVEASAHLPSAPGISLGANAGYYSSRGLLIGPSGNYAQGDTLKGFFRTGFINDHGDKKFDILGRPVPENRGYVEWEHRQQLTENLAVSAQANWWKDSEVLRDFRPRAFFPVQEPDTTVESVYTGANYFVSAFTRFQPNSFHAVQERLPEIRFDLMPLAVGAGLYETFSASAAVLREHPLPFGPANPRPGGERASNRLDAYYSLERPIAPNDWLALTPVIGARVTHYANTRTTASDLTPAAAGSALSPTPGDYTRTMGEFGFDALVRTSGKFDYQNTRWGINGLRHLLTPRVGYRYVPAGGRGRGLIPMIDRQAFSTYLQPLGLGAIRNVDDLRATNTLRVGLDNTLQTRDAEYGSRDLFSLNVAGDFRFKRSRGERDFSEVHSDVAFAPAHWLQVDAYSRFTPQTGTLQELNSGVTLHDGGAWSVRFSNNFLRRQIEDYVVDGRLRLNERYSALTRLHYDARKRRFNEQAYGVMQNLDYTWRVAYVVSLYSGPRRESNFGLNVQVEALGF